jgi:nucleoside-diphosphate-sugar epimerase
LQRGDHVTLYNRGATASRVPAGTRLIAGDRERYAAFENQMKTAGTFDCVIDMVGFHPADTASAIRAFAGRTAQFIFCSTVDVYRKPATRLPYTEAEPHGGLNDYARNKVECERLLLAAQARGDLAVTIIRPAYTYGPGRRLLYPVGSACTYVERIRAGKPIIVPGDGNSLWVACHVEDQAKAFGGAIGNAKAIGRAYHTTGEEWLTWNRYHETVAEAIGAPSPRFVHIPTEQLLRVVPQRAASVADNFQFNNVFDNGAARADLGFDPKLSWREGVTRTVAWLDANPRFAPPDLPGIDDRLIAAWQAGTDRFASAF